MNETYTTLVGNVVADPVTVSSPGTRPVTRFRLAVTERSFNSAIGRSVDGRTSFYQVSAWGYLGLNAGESLRKGERVIVYGKLAVEQYQGKEGDQRTSVVVEARSLGHDLTFGGTRFRKQTHPESTATEEAPDACTPDGAEGAGAKTAQNPPAADDAVPRYQEVDGLYLDPAGELAGSR